MTRNRVGRTGGGPGTNGHQVKGVAKRRPDAGPRRGDARRRARRSEAPKLDFDVASLEAICESHGGPGAKVESGIHFGRVVGDVTAWAQERGLKTPRYSSPPKGDATRTFTRTEADMVVRLRYRDRTNAQVVADAFAGVCLASGLDVDEATASLMGDIAPEIN